MRSTRDTANDKPPLTRWLVWCGIALVALLAGLYAGTMTSTTTADSAQNVTDSAELAKVQKQLVNTRVLPEDFKRLPDFDLVDGSGEAITADFLDERWTMLFFGFTHCPDVCPITLSAMKGVKQRLEKLQAEPLQVAFVSVDPKRDTPDVMGRYVKFFDDDFIGITGELNDVHALTSELGIVAAFTANEDAPENYTVDHTASMLLVDPQRRVRAKFNAPHEVDSIVADYQTLLAAFN